MKRYVLIILCIIISANICSCTTSFSFGNIDDKDIIEASSNLSKQPNNMKIDWDKCGKDTKHKIENSNKYNYVDDYTITIDENNKAIEFIILVRDNTTLVEIKEVSNDLVRIFNDVAHQQDSSIKESGEYYLGGIYDTYTIAMGVTTKENEENREKWYVCDSVDSGVQVAPVLQKKYRIQLNEY